MWRLPVGLVLVAVVQMPGCVEEPAAEHPPAAASALAPGAPLIARVSPQARKNLGLVVQPAALGSFQRTIEVPAVVTDRPGISDRGVVAPVTGVVTQIFAYPGNTVAPDATLFTIRLVSERLHASQLELFKATKEIEIAKQQRQRLIGLSESGVLAQSRIIEIDNRLQLLDVNIQAYRQDLLARGLPQARLEAASRGEFVTEITVRAPSRAKEGAESSAELAKEGTPSDFEVQALRVELGQQVEGGAVLCELGDHHQLLIAGQAYKSDLPLLQEAVRTNAAISAEFEEQGSGIWTSHLPLLRIEHLANTVDPETRVIRFTIPLTNQWREYTREGKKGILWRFRPGDRARLKIPAERRDDVFVLPRDAVVREGAEAYVFRQNGDLFDRRPVTILEESRTQMAIANDGSIKPGMYLAQNAAASLQRIVKAQAASGLPANVHVHADGTVHAAH